MSKKAIVILPKILIISLILNIVCTNKKDNATVNKNDTFLEITDKSTDNSNVGIAENNPVEENRIEEENIEEMFIKNDTAPDNSKSLDRQVLSDMIHHYFEMNPSCVFGANKEHDNIIINNIIYHGFATGASQLFYGYYFNCQNDMPGINDVFAWQLGKDSEGYESSPVSLLIKELSGIKPFNSVKEFSYINPEFVEWAMKNLIPDPESTVFGVSCKRIYETMFSGFCRILYQSLLWLECVDNRYENECNEYRQKYSKGSPVQPYGGITYLQETYKNIHFKFIGEDVSFTEPEAIGFWLRRNWDGSYPMIKKALIDILDKYDTSILNDQYLKKYVSNRFKEDSMESSEFLHFLIQDLTIEFPQFRYRCNYDEAQLDSLDTVYLDMSAFEGCAAGSMDTINIFKNKNITDVSIALQGSKTFHFNEEGKGGVWTENILSKIWSEDVQLNPVSGNEHSYIKQDIFNAKDIKWEKFTKRDSVKVDSILSNSKDIYCNVWPFEEIIKLEWKRSSIDKSYKKYVVLQFGYGD